ncbi:pre-RNA processing protein [Raphidocelis subcapitata]|uniref:Pre-RNA processing protein n=1 Tax=Raphidocelis subcapitata TaxID=307507 RepID=A0A2V0NM92_9CHLO|nr:pre-RNA processing protein [Raphidocelis subcapitata]|eukprot:GBF88596.1 pre-RNA processing protein [Raphidocelis subcapitata]
MDGGGAGRDEAAARLAALDPFPDASEEELLAMLEACERSGALQGPVTEDLQEMLRNVKRGKGQPVEETATEEITPAPGFVVKTADQDGRKVFVNVCSSDRIPAPGGWADGLPPEAVESALASAAAADGDAGAPPPEALRLPISVGSLRGDADKRGEACGTVDVVLNSGMLAAAARHRPLKAFLIDLVLGQVGQKHGLLLDPKYKLPKMAYKGGAPAPQRVRCERQPLVRELPGGGGGGGGRATATAAPAPAPAPAPARAAAAPPRAGAAAPLGELMAAVELEGRPVSAARATVRLGARGAAPGDVCAEVCGPDLFVSAPGARELAVRLPFAVSAAGARAELVGGCGGGEGSGGGEGAGSGGGQELRLRLPYLPLRQWVDELAAAAPRAFASLPVEGAAYMELA